MYRKRKWKRDYLVAEVKIRPYPNGTWMHTVLMNINKGGIGLYAMSEIAKNQKVAVRITYLERGKMREVEEIHGTIRWVQFIGMHYAAGIMFEEQVTKDNFPILSRCLEYARNKKGAPE